MPLTVDVAHAGGSVAEVEFALRVFAGGLSAGPPPEGPIALPGGPKR